MPAQQQDPFDDLLGSDSPPAPPRNDIFHEGRHIDFFHQGSSTARAPAAISQRGSSPDSVNQATYALDPFFDEWVRLAIDNRIWRRGWHKMPT